MSEDAAKSELSPDLIDKYLDDELSVDECAQLQERLAHDPQFTKGFVETAFLHDQLRARFLARAAMHTPLSLNQSDHVTVDDRGAASSRTRHYALLAVAAATVLFALLFWWGQDSTAVAGQLALRKMLAASSLTSDRTFTIDVESSVIGGAKQKRRSPEATRPPKPPLDGATLWVRGKNEYVLKRTTLGGNDFVTGCDGQSSWAVRPDGPVRVSRDLNRFNHDVPGHEFSLPLVNLSEALSHLQHAFELNALPAEYADAPVELDNSTRLLVATKKRGYPGPRRVEITYRPQDGQIEQIRFFDMPYGTDRLTVRLSLVATEPVASSFFQHAAHHAPDRAIEQE